MNELETIKQSIEDAVYRWRRYRDASSPIDQAHALVKLQDAMSDLTSWVTGYDYNTDSLPWEREEWVD